MNSMPLIHSAGVRLTSRAKAWRCLTADAMIVFRRGSGVVAIWSSTASVIVSGVSSRMRHSPSCRLFFEPAGRYCSKPNRLLGINTRRSKAALTPLIQIDELHIRASDRTPQVSPAHRFCDCTIGAAEWAISRGSAAQPSPPAPAAARAERPPFARPASGRAGCGGMSEGLWPVVAGSEGADGFVSAPGVDCVGCVACAICRGSLVLSTVSASAEMASPAAISMDASSISRRYSRWRSSAGMSFTHEIVRGR